MYKVLLILVLAIVTVQGQSTDAPSYGPPTVPPGNEVIQYNFLTGANLYANKSYTVWTTLGFSVNVQVVADVKLTFHLDVQVTGLPRGIEQIQFAGIGVSLGFQVKASVDGAIKSISVSSPPIPSFLGDRVADGFNNAVVALDKRVNLPDVFTTLVATYDKITRKVTVELPVTLPVIIFVQVQGKVQAQLNTPYNIIAGANQTIQFDADVAVTFRSNLPNAITVKKSNITAKGTIEALQRAGKALGVFLDITLANKTVIHDSIIRLAYTAADLIRAGIQDAHNLKLAYFDEISQIWVYARDTFVNITGQYLECRTPHFSEWAAFDVSTAPAANDNQTYGPPTVPAGTEVIQANFLTGVDLKANKSYTVWTVQGFSVNVQVVADVTLTFHLVAQVTGFPRGIEQINFASIGVSLGFQVKASVDGAIKSISVSSPPIPSFLGDRVANGFNNGVLALDKSLNVDVFSNLVATYDKNTRKVTVELPVTLPVIIFVQVQGKVQAQLNTPYNIIAGANQTIQFDADVAVTFRSNLPNAITVKKSNITAKGTVEALRRAGKALGVFLDITLANKTVVHDSIIRLAYTAADLIRAGIQDARNLKLAYFDELTQNWIYARDTFVNITGQYLECRTPHFSEWGAFDSSTAQNSASTITLSFTSIVMMIITVLTIRQ